MDKIKPIILVTGGAGYIGSHTIIELLKLEHFEIISIDNYNNSSPKTFDRIKKITGIETKNYEIDMTNKAGLEQVFIENKKIVGVIHFAALKAVGESVEKPLLYFSNNLGSLINLLEYMKKFEVKHLIFSSSCTVYGNANKLPVSEQSPLQKPESPYGLTKLMGEEIIESELHSNNKLKATILRYFNPVGAHVTGLIGEDPRNKPNNLVPIITQTVIGKLPALTVHGNNYPTRDGTCIRDYVHVSDIASAHVKALEHLLKPESKNHNIFNLGTGNGVSVLEVIKAFEKSTQQKLSYNIGPKRPGDVAAIYADNSLAKKELGWEPQYSLEEMMLNAWKWQQNQS